MEEEEYFYDTSPLSDADFRNGQSVLSREDIQVEPNELEGKDMLDCGCGPGNISIYLLKNVKKQRENSRALVFGLKIFLCQCMVNMILVEEQLVFLLDFFKYYIDLLFCYFGLL